METNNSQLVIYQAPDGNMSIDVTVQNDTVWLSQGQMAELFDKDQSVISPPHLLMFSRKASW